jgi:hypothetical protein
MAVYRFRVFIEDDHEIYRDIDVLGKQRFADLHQEIVKSFNFQKNQPAEYVHSDQSWHEGDTVAELDESGDGDHQKIASHISAPRQRFLCVLVSFRELGLAIELQKVLKDEAGVTYPHLVRSEGNTPYYTQPPPKQIEDEPEDAPIPEMEMDMFSGEGPSEAEIERIGKEAEAASKAGLMKAPEVDMSRLKEKSRKKKEERKEDGFEEFNMDDLM